jgi:hypothetical protein
MRGFGLLPNTAIVSDDSGQFNVAKKRSVESGLDDVKTGG